jgi:hypothetical protein
MINHRRTLDILLVLLGMLFALMSLQMLISYKIVEYLVMVVRGLLFLKLLSYVAKVNKKYLGFYFLLFFYYLIYGLFCSNFVPFIIMDLLSACSILFLFVMSDYNKHYVTNRVFSILSGLMPFAAILSLIYLSVYGFRPAEVLGERIVFEQEGSNFKLLYQTIGLSIVLLPFIWFVSAKRKWAIILTFIVFAVINLITLSRGYLAGSFISILVTVFIGFKLNMIRFTYGTVVLVLVFLFSSIYLYNVNRDVIGTSLRLLEYRVEGMGEEVEPRDVEAEFYFKNLPVYELFFGKGMGAANQSPFGKHTERGIMMMHRGENNLIMKGGLLLLVIIYGLCIYALVKLSLSKDIYSNSWAGVVLVFLLLERGHQQFSNVFMLILLCMAISYSFSLKNKLWIK